jgi:hypothetical protein
MSLTFLNPWLLFGLAGAILPILIHRITQRRVIRRRFSAVHLLLQSQRTTAKSQRLTHLLVLALRILAIATIVFLMAGPVLVRPGAHLLEEGAMVMILDNSLSMAYEDDRGQRYEVAKKAAAEVLKGFQGSVALIPTVRDRGGQGLGWMTPKGALRALESLPLSFGPGDPPMAFKSAYRHLHRRQGPKQILVVSDMARSDWQRLELTGLQGVPDANVTFFKIGESGRDTNVCIKDVRLADGDMVAGVANRLAVTLSNLSNQTETRLVQITLADKKVDQKSMKLEAGQDGTVFFDFHVEDPGWIDGEVTLSPDRLNADDRFYLSLNVRDKIKILAVDGDPKTSLKAGESYYVVNALRPEGMDGSPFLTRVITEGELAREDPGTVDTLFLMNVERPDFSKVAAALERGKTVFLFLGDRILPEVYNRFSGFPWQIGRRIDVRDRAQKAELNHLKPGSLTFLKHLENSLSGASFQTYFKIEGTGENLLTLGNQDPLLVMSEAGNARLFLFASSADVDWNDLPLTAAFLPLLQGLVKHSVALTGNSLPGGIPFGKHLRDTERPVQIKGPPGGPGVYQFHVPAGEMRRGVNMPYEESDLAKVTEDEIKKKFGAMNVALLDYSEAGLSALKGGRKSVWPLLLLFLAAVLALEMILANEIPLPVFKIRSAVRAS